RTILAALHDLRQALEFFPRAILLDGGRLTADGPTDLVVLGPALEAAFGVRVQVGGGLRLSPIHVPARGGRPDGPSRSPVQRGDRVSDHAGADRLRHVQSRACDHRIGRGDPERRGALPASTARTDGDVLRAVDDRADPRPVAVSPVDGRPLLVYNSAT